MALARKPQLARKANRALVEGARKLLLLLVPPTAKDVKSGITVFRVSQKSTKWLARAFVQWVPGRGTKARGFGLDGVGDNPDHALSKLMAALEKAPLLK
jgi:hypothetical protein